MYSLICYIHLPFSAQRIISKLDRANGQNLVGDKEKYKDGIAESTLEKQEKKHEERRKGKKKLKKGVGVGDRHGVSILYISSFELIFCFIHIHVHFSVY